jgi:hypothetical protein
MPPTVAHTVFRAITPLGVFEQAGPLQQLVVITLILAAVAVLAIKLSGGRRLSGGSAFLSSLRFGAPIIGILGACDSGLNMTLGMANLPFPPTLKMFAPGIAESFLMIGLGFFAGAIAVFAHWVVESRIDRQVLGA